MVFSAAMRFLLTCLQILSSLEGQFPPIHGVEFPPPRKTWQSDTRCSEITIGLTNIVFPKFNQISDMSMITLAAMHWPISFQLLSGVTSATHRGATGLNCSVPTIMPHPHYSVLYSTRSHTCQRSLWLQCNILSICFQLTNGGVAPTYQAHFHCVSDLSPGRTKHSHSASSNWFQASSPGPGKSPRLVAARFQLRINLLLKIDQIIWPNYLSAACLIMSMVE